jgi:Flp pilus assembly protein TadD
VYIVQVFYPLGLAAYYPHPSYSLPLWQATAALAALLLVSIAVFVPARKRPYLLVGWLWYLGTLVPVVGLVQVGAQARADRYTYLSQIGLYIMLFWFAADLVRGRRWLGWASGVPCALFVTVLMVCAWRQTGYWHDNVALWTHAIDCTPDNDFAPYSLGVELRAQGRVAEAIEHFRRAVEIKPEYCTAQCNLGSTLYLQGDIDGAIVHCRLALELSPRYAEAHNGLAVALYAKGKVREALEHMSQALEIDPQSAFTHNNMGTILNQQGEVGKAILHYRQALACDPKLVEARWNLANALSQQGKRAEAVELYEGVLQANPRDAKCHTNLGIVLVQAKQFGAGIAHLQRAVELDEKNGAAM